MIRNVKLKNDLTFLFYSVYHLYMDINKLIKQYLKVNKITQFDFASQVGVRPETICRYVCNKSWPKRTREKHILEIMKKNGKGKVKRWADCE